MLSAMFGLMTTFTSSSARVRLFVYALIILALAIAFFVSSTAAFAGPATSGCC